MLLSVQRKQFREKLESCLMLDVLFLFSHPELWLLKKEKIEDIIQQGITILFIT